MPSLGDLTSFLDEYLQTEAVPDYPGAHNGLQVENGGSVTKVAAAVDACQFTIDRAADLGADLLLVHHGLFWDGPAPVTGRRYRRLEGLIKKGIALYSSHLPLDRHPEVGNNALLATALGLEDRSGFGDFQGSTIGVRGQIDISLAELVERLQSVLGGDVTVIAGGPERCRELAVVTGGAGSMVSEAASSGVDTFVTGEGSHHTFVDAEELGINLVYGGHYATETFGVKALAAVIESRFGLPWEFIDHPTGL